ncbi:TPA: phage tail tip fiber protein [Vibrio cholerae]
MAGNTKSPFRAGRSLDALYENVEILTGQRGNGRYRAVTEKDVAAIKGTVNKIIVGGGSNGGDSVVEPPHAPNNVEAFGGFSAILVQWDTPRFKGFAYAEVWRAGANDFSQAVLIATTPANVFSDVVNLGSHYFYWVRFVNTNDLAGPYHDVNGVAAETSQDIAGVVDELAEQLKSSELIQHMQKEIDNKAAQDALDSLDEELTALDKEMAESGKLIGRIETILQNVSQVLALQIKQLNAAYVSRDLAQTVSTNAKIVEVSKVSSDAYQALAQKILQLTSDFETADQATNALLSELRQTVAEADLAMSERVDTVEAKANSAGEVGEAAKAAAQTNAKAIATINKDGSTAFQALWSTKVQAGDIKAGIGIVAKSDGTSQVAVSASQFFVYDPNKPGTLVPTFAIDNGAVVIPKALIESATIQVLQAQQITADYVKAGIEIASPLINAGQLRGGDAGFGAGGPYNGYHTFIHSNGLLQTNNLQANNGYFRGNIEGTSINGGVIKGATIIASTFYQSVVLYTTFGDNVTTSFSYPSALGGGLVVTSESVRVNVPTTTYYTDGATSPLDFFPAGDMSINTLSRARYRTIPDYVFTFDVRRPHVGGSGFLQIFVQAINLSGGVVAEAMILGTDRPNNVGTTVNVAGVTFVLDEYDGGSGGYGVRGARINSRRSLFGHGWTYNGSQSLRFRLRFQSLWDGAVVVNMSASINNTIDPR